MATVVDASRDADYEKGCAAAVGAQDTQRTFTASVFDITEPAAAETHCPVPNDAGDNGTDNTSDAWVPHVDFTDFWNDSTPATVRF